MDSTMIDLGFFQIKWYSFFMLVAILTASIFVYLEARKKELEKDEIIDMIFYGVLIGIVGARVYYVLFNLNYYLKDPIEIICIWHGGLAIHGALIATLLFLYFYCNKKNRNLLLLLDIIVVGIIIGQAIGRWGNFFNGEAFGRTVELSFLRNLHLPKFIIQGMYIDNQYREPTFLYESISSVLGFIVLLFVRKSKNIKTGTLTSIYLIWYGITRLIVESFRSDSLMLGNMKIAQIISCIAIVSGIIIWIKSKKNRLYHKDTI